MVASKHRKGSVDLHHRPWWCAVTYVHVLAVFWMVFGLALLAGGTAQALPLADSANPTAPASTVAPHGELPTLVIGSEQDFPPFATGMTDATAGGFTVDLWKAVAAEQGLAYTLRVRPFHQLLDEFKAGEIDVLINLAKSDERHQFADFSVPHVTVHGAIFVRKGQSGISTEDDLAGKSIIVINADLAHEYARSKGWEKQLVLVETATEGLRLLSNGQSDAMLLSKLTGLQTLQAQGLTNLQALGIKLGFSQKFGFATHHGQTDLLARLNEGLALTKANGVYNALYEKWFGLYEEKEVGLRDVLKYTAPVVVLLLAWVGYLFYQRQNERQQAHAVAMATRDLLMTIIETAPIRVFWKDRHLRYLGCNALFARDAGMAHSSEVIGKDDDQMGWAAQAERHRADDLAVITSGEAKLAYEEPQTTPGGQTIWRRTSKVPLRDHHQKIIGLLGVYEDITEQKKVEKTILDAAQYNRSLIEASLDPLMTINAQGKISDINLAMEQVTGLGRHALIGSDFANYFTDSKKAHEGCQSAFSQGAISDCLLAIRHASGQVTDVLLNASVYRDTHGNVLGILAAVRDVTARNKAESEVLLLNKKMDSLLNSMAEGAYGIDADGVCTFINQSFLRLLGYAESKEVIGKPIHALIHHSHADGSPYPASECRMNAAYQHNQSIHESDDVFWRQDGTAIPVEFWSQPIVVDGVVTGAIATFFDITARKLAEEKIHQLAFYDTLTQLPNRRLLKDRLGQVMLASQRSALYGAVMMLDLDNFKSLNDTHGHLVGDLLLIEVARRLTLCVREMDTVARFGGDEFVVMLGGLGKSASNSVSLCKGIAENICLSLAATYVLDVTHDGAPPTRVEHHCTASVGVAVFVGSETSQEEVLKRADAAMYAAKDAGRNTFRFYEAKDTV